MYERDCGGGVVCLVLEREESMGLFTTSPAACGVNLFDSSTCVEAAFQKLSHLVIGPNTCDQSSISASCSRAHPYHLSDCD